MSQRDSGYERKERDLYETPEWVTEALIPHLSRRPSEAWECAAGTWKMSAVLAKHMRCYPTDIHCTDGTKGIDFLEQNIMPDGCDSIITNPPYELATEFVEHALRLTQTRGGLVAMLLRTDFDHAKSRAHLFGKCHVFVRKVVLTKRIVWFEPEPGAKGKSPSFNHAWFIWDWSQAGVDPILAYGP